MDYEPKGTIFEPTAPIPWYCAAVSQLLHQHDGWKYSRHSSRRQESAPNERVWSREIVEESSWTDAGVSARRCLHDKDLRVSIGGDDTDVQYSP